MRPCSTPSGMVDSLTNSARRPAEEAIEAAGLLAWIECVIASDEARAHTPSLAVYRSHPIEQALLDGDVLAYESHQTDASGVNSTFYVEIAPTSSRSTSRTKALWRGSPATTTTRPIRRRSVNAPPGNSQRTSASRTAGSQPSPCTAPLDRLKPTRTRGATVRAR